MHHFFLDVQGQRRVFSLQEGQDLLIGRGVENALPIAEDPGVSKVHARIFLRAGLPYIEDAGSRNGTYVNTVAVKVPVLLRTGDVITLGSTTIAYVQSSGLLPAGPGPGREAGRQSGVTCVLPLREMVRDPHASPVITDAQQLQAEVRRMEILQEIASSLLDLRDLDDLFRKCLHLIQSVIPAQRACLMMTEDGELKVKAYLDRAVGPQKVTMDILRFSNTIRRQVMEQRSSVITANVEADPTLEGAKSVIIQGIKAVMCVPLWNGDSVYGLIYLDSSVNEQSFNEKNLRLLTAIANLITMKIENFLYIEELLTKRSMEKELEFASEVQKFLIQPQFPTIANFETAAFYQSCHQLGGDYYHCFLLPDGRFLVVIADVMGKGAGAALLTSSIHAYLRSFCDWDLSLDALVGRINNSIHELCRGTFFITMFAVVGQPSTGEVLYVNAGHNPGLLLTAGGECHVLENGGLLLGMMPDAPYQVGRLVMSPGDLLFLFTDGVVEMEDPQGEMLGDDKLRRFLTDGRWQPVQALSDNLVQAIHSFRAGCAAHDDMTGIFLKRL